MSSNVSFKSVKRKRNLRETKASKSSGSSNSSDSDDGNVAVKKQASKSHQRGIFSQSVRAASKSHGKGDESDDDVEDSDDESNISSRVTSTFKSSKTSAREGPKDLGAASAILEIDTAHDRDNQAIVERSLEAQEKSSGQADAKIYEGQSNYHRYYKKKDTVHGNAASSKNRHNFYRCKMDVDQLIMSVYKRPILWDRRMREHSNRLYVAKLWRDISLEMGFDETALRKKWKSLRDYFAIEYGKRKPKDGADNPTSRWQYFRQLLFLKDVIAPQVSFSALEDGLTKEELQGSEDNEWSDGEGHPYVSVSTLQEEHMSGPSMTMTPGSASPSVQNVSETEMDSFSFAQETRSRKRRKESKTESNGYQDVIDLENRRYMEYLISRQLENTESDDADMLFLKSLHPFMKEIPSHLKLSFRSRVQSLLEDFICPAQQRTMSQGDLQADQSLPPPPPPPPPPPAPPPPHCSTLSFPQDYNAHNASC